MNLDYLTADLRQFDYKELTNPGNCPQYYKLLQNWMLMLNCLYEHEPDYHREYVRARLALNEKNLQRCDNNTQRTHLKHDIEVCKKALSDEIQGLFFMPF